MFGFSKRANVPDAFRQALDRSLAIIEFDPSGRILAANENYCRVFGYKREELIGQTHAIFFDPAYAKSQAYRDKWAKLARGETMGSNFKRLGKGGHEVWISATYSPQLDAAGKLQRIIEVARDITQDRLKANETQAKLEAISRVQAVIEFTPSGEILACNENFERATGYTSAELKGQHHRMLVAPGLAASAEYREHWAKLARGEPIVGSFERVGKGGKPVILLASYNPVIDPDGKVIKVVKFAKDFTDLVDLGEGLKRFAAGDIAKPIERPFSEYFEAIRKDFNAVQHKLAAALGSIAESADLVAAGGKEVTSAAEDLSHRTEQQAANLEETAAALSAVTENVKKAADNSTRARNAVGETRAEAERSGDVVRRAVDAMGRIEKSSQQISQIIGVIDEIAFQTNLLALNAGVEAARAGEAGRGFAVVASEVRALAQRSAEAAKEIKGLISASSDEVGDGVKLVGETGDSLSRIIGRVGDINALIAEIAAGAEEQSNALLEVNSSVSQMDEAVQQNAAMAEQSTAASRSLLTEADRLAELVAQFDLGRRSSKANLRQELQRVAPHAFAERPAAPPPPAKRPAPAPAKRVAASGGGASAQDWAEF